MEELSLRDVRLRKLARLREIGLDPFAVEKWSRDGSATELVARTPEEGASDPVSFAGRLVSHRIMGKAGFAHLSDGDARIQVYVRRDDVTPEEWEAFKDLADLGDHYGVEGTLSRTRTGEASIFVTRLRPLSKALSAVPIGKEKDGETFNALSDIETRYRHRHLDLLANPEGRKTLIDRARIVSAVRRYFDDQGYLEVETPILQVQAGGAAARPFTTHHNAYEIDVKLRISLELYLKRIICGDVPAVYEVGRVFRNEGVSNRHNPEFTLLEFYEAYADLETMMERTEGVFRAVARMLGTSPVDFEKPWRRLDLLSAIEEATGLTREDLSDFEIAKARAAELGVPAKARAAGGAIDLASERNLGGLIEKLLEVFIEPGLQEPTFVVGYPIETSPLAKKDPNDPRMTRRFEGYVLGREVCNAFSEINDPIDQRERFEQQAREAAKGDDEAHPLDEEFLAALESGMPPTGGCGIGLDRMAMLLTGADQIREVLFFPFMKPRTQETPAAE